MHSRILNTTNITNFVEKKMIFVFYANLFLFLDDLFLGSDCLHSFQKWRMWMVPAGVERIVDGEGEVVVVQLHQGWDQHLAAAEGPVGKLVSLEFKATTQSRHAEVQELERNGENFLKEQFLSSRDGFSFKLSKLK